jgi:hypothetical protein
MKKDIKMNIIAVGCWEVVWFRIPLSIFSGVLEVTSSIRNPPPPDLRNIDQRIHKYYWELPYLWCRVSVCCTALHDFQEVWRSIWNIQNFMNITVSDSGLSSSCSLSEQFCNIFSPIHCTRTREWPHILSSPFANSTIACFLKWVYSLR